MGESFVAKETGCTTDTLDDDIEESSGRAAGTLEDGATKAMDDASSSA